MTITGGEPTRVAKDPSDVVIARLITIGKAYLDAIVATEIDDAPLPPEHGCPVRFVVPGYFGINSVKRLIRLELAIEESQAAKHRTAYRIRPVSQSGSPAPPSIWEMPVKSPTRFEYSSAREEILVEEVILSESKAAVRAGISVDGGASWPPAHFRAPISGPFGSRGFRRVPDIDEAAPTICTRAVDEVGKIQPREIALKERGYANNAWSEHAIGIVLVAVGRLIELVSPEHPWLSE